MPYPASSRFAAIGLASALLFGCEAESPEPAVGEAEEFSPVAFAAACEAWDDWDKPAPPFRIYGETYHVGTCGISAILVASPEGHLLIDTGTRAGSELVAANIEALRFSIADVRYLTHTQEHGDHIGGMAHLKALTGARMIASPRAESVFETGYLNRDDPQYEPGEPMPRVQVDGLIANGEALEVGGRSVVAHFTPGHSPGSITWRWEECEDSQCLTLLFTDGLGPFSAEGYRWSDHPDYLAGYRASVDWLASMPVDICLAAHPSQMRLIERIESGSLVDAARCRENAAFTRERIEIIVADERGS
jgi:metallo-beta-lactamase class B